VSIEQPELPLPPLRDDQPYVPARMVNEFQYCPRFLYIEWVRGEWVGSADTVEARGAHRRVDRSPGGGPGRSARPGGPQGSEVGPQPCRPVRVAGNRGGPPSVGGPPRGRATLAET
jgi:hypothetical protein